MLALTSLFKHTYQNIKVGGQRLGLLCLDGFALLGYCATPRSRLVQRGRVDLTHVM